MRSWPSRPARTTLAGLPPTAIHTGSTLACGAYTGEPSHGATCQLPRVHLYTTGAHHVLRPRPSEPRSPLRGRPRPVTRVLHGHLRHGDHSCRTPGQRRLLAPAPVGQPPRPLVEGLGGAAPGFGVLQPL